MGQPPCSFVVPHTRYNKMLPYLWGYAALLALSGFLLDTPEHILSGLKAIVLTEDALITDYVMVAGAGAALVNSALVTAISLCAYPLRFLTELWEPTMIVLAIAGFITSLCIMFTLFDLRRIFRDDLDSVQPR